VAVFYNVLAFIVSSGLASGINNFHMNYFVTAIGTDCGKTIVSAILCQALKADYWKPVQAGLPSDSDSVRSLLDNGQTTVHPERFVFKAAASPHAAAALENITIRLDDFVEPRHRSDLVIEGAGGCLVPLNDDDFVIDLASKFNAQVVLVSNIYLGSINHTLLSYEALISRKLNISGIIFNGPSNRETERIILRHTGMQCLLRIDQELKIDSSMIAKYSKLFIERSNG
jgi:dethiobiotin synthetase